VQLPGARWVLPWHVPRKRQLLVQGDAAQRPVQRQQRRPRGQVESARTERETMIWQPTHQAILFLFRAPR
jgi:hypothetical protein